MDPLEIWPVFGLRIRTPRLELRAVDPDLAFALADLATDGIHDPATMPFLAPWTEAPPPELRRNSVRHYWQTFAACTPEDWHLPFAVFEGATLVGAQGILARDFAPLRLFETGSWLGRSFQGRGIGKEMRSAILHLGFAGLEGQRACTGAFADNERSLAVTRSQGYEANGSTWRLRRGTLAEEQLFVMDRAAWQARRRDDITIEGLTPACLGFLGLD